MRTSQNKTEKYFAEKNVPYKDTVQQIQNRDIHYIQTGPENAATLVFMHGSPGSWDAYKSYLTDSVLLKKFRIIVPDRPGFGYSDFRRSLGLKDQAALLNQLLVQLSNGKEYTLIGHSYGGPLIVQMAIDQPALYDNLAILAGALDPTLEKPEKWRYPFRGFPLKFLVPGALRPSNEELILLKTELKYLKEELHKLSQNVLIIHGTKDKLVPYGNVAFMQKEFSSVENMKLHRLEQQNHFFVWEKERFVKDSLLSWLKELEKP
ncbi:MAG: alpha/beta hydrolase [Bacteroidota bacterium]